MDKIIELIEEGRVSRFFQARHKLSFQGAICHITQRASGKELLFVEDGDYLYMLYLIKKISKKFNIKMFSFVLMPNHLHLLLRLLKNNLSEAMKDLFETYAIYFNKKYQRRGHLFCGPFRQALCFDDSYLLAASLYIHLNPLRAGLIKNLMKYRWSSCNLYIQSLKGKTFIDYKFILQILDTEVNKAREMYKQLMQDMSKIKTKEILEDPKALDIFRETLIQRIQNSYRTNKDIVKFSFLFIDEELNEQINRLREKGRLRRPQDIKARKFLIEQLKSRGFKIEEIAERLGLSRQSIYSTINLTK